MLLCGHGCMNTNRARFESGVGLKYVFAVWFVTAQYVGCVVRGTLHTLMATCGLR